MAQTPADRRRPASGPTRGIQAQQSRAAGPPPLVGAWELGALSPLGSPLGNLRQTPPQVRNTVTLNGRTYREIDNGKAGVLVPIQESGASQVARTQQRRAIERAQIMANSPLAGAAFGLASLAGAPPRTRDWALRVGENADAALGFGAPRAGAGARRRPVRRPAPEVQRDGSIRYREANAAGQSQGVHASLGAPMLGTGGPTKRRVKPPGFVSGKAPHGHHRAHLLGKQLGGHADKPKKVFAAIGNPTNSPQMSSFESDVARKVASGELIEYSVIPHYTPGMPAPSFIAMSAWGSGGTRKALVLENPLGRPKK